MDFWRAILTIAATFTGLIIAGYSIFIARTEKAASDPICRQYFFKECSSVNSFYFMLFALMMFAVPFVLAAFTLTSLMYSIQTSYPNLLWYVALMVIILVGLSIGGQCLYLFRIFRYNWQLDKLKGRKKRWFLLVQIIVLLIFDVLVTSVLLNNIAHILFILDTSNSIGIYLKSILYGDALPPEAGVILSFCIGMLLIFLHLYIFQPERFLFRIDDVTHSSLMRIKAKIEDECVSLKTVKKWILFTIDRTKLKLVQENVQTKEAEEILERMRTYATEKLQQEILNKEKEHTGSLEFCKRRKFITYDGITWIMNDINLYTEGLSRFDSGLKEIPEQLYLLTELLKVTDVTNERPNDRAITSISDNRPGNHSKVVKFLKRIFGW